MIFKYILITLLVLFLGYFLLLPRKAVFRKSFVLAFVALMMVFTVKPEWSTDIAQSVGVSRGVDLLFYSSHMVLFFVAFMYYLKFKDLELRLSKLVRQLALDAARTEPRARNTA
jgi:small membrane protein